MQFSQTSGNSTPMDLLPRGFLCWAMLTYRGMKTSDKTGSRYADLELTIADRQPFARKKIWTMVGDPDYSDNSEGYRNMGMTALTRMVEAAGIVNPSDAASYEKLNGLPTEKVMMMLDGKYVALSIGIEKGEGGYPDKNKVGDFLTPNEQSSGYKNFMKLSNGDHGNTGQNNPAASRGGFGSQSGTQARPAATSSAPVHNGGFSGQQRQLEAPQTERPVAPQEQPRQGFNPNSAPQFLREHSR